MKNNSSSIGNRLRVGVIGSGSWATAMIKMLQNNSQEKDIFWWIRKEETANYIKEFKHNPRYVSAIPIQIENDHISTDIQFVVDNSDVIILNTPAAYLKAAIDSIPLISFQNKIIVSAIKGIVPDENLIIGEYLNEKLQIDWENIVVVGGPCHAEEVAQERLSYLTIGCSNLQNAKIVSDLLANRYINTKISEDIIGIEYAAVLKNIYAVACGICHGLGYGDNFQAVLVSNALREMNNFVDGIKCMDRNIMHSAYLGDLLVTSYSNFSRNRTFGNMIGKGYSVNAAQIEMNMIAEGYYASKCIQSVIEKHRINLPICEAVYSILHKNRNAKDVMNDLSKKLI